MTVEPNTDSRELTPSAEKELNVYLQEAREAIVRRAWEQSAEGVIGARGIRDARRWYEAQVADTVVFQPRERRPSSRSRAINWFRIQALGFAIAVLGLILAGFALWWELYGGGRGEAGRSVFVSLSASAGTLFVFGLSVALISRLGDSDVERRTISIARFIDEWQAIERLVLALAIDTSQDPNAERMTLGANLLALQNDGVIDAPVAAELRALIGVRNDAVHGRSNSVSTLSIKRAKAARKLLEDLDQKARR